MPLAGSIGVTDGENQNWIDSRATLYRSAVEVAVGDSEPIIFSRIFMGEETPQSKKCVRIKTLAIIPTC